MLLRRLPLVVLTLFLAGCVLPFEAQTSPPPTAEIPPPTSPSAETAEPEARATLSPPSGPAILLQQPVGAGTLLLIRYQGAGQPCLAATFTAEVFQANRCDETLTLAPASAGGREVVGVGYVDTLTDPAGTTVRLAYGVVHNPAITVVAVEFVGGGSASAPVQNGGYALALSNQQQPRRASGIDQYGYLVGQWSFE